MGNTKYAKPLRWGIIGCGAVTEVKSGPPYQQTRDFQLTAVMRRDEKKAEDYAKRHGVPKFYSKAEDLIADPEVDAVYIATPPDTHKHYALMVAGVGKPCCVEKPMAPCHADSLEIFNVFKERKLPLFVAYYRRSLPRFLKIKEWLDTDKIGEVRHIRWHLSKPPSTEDLQKTYNWRTDGEVAPGGYFDDLASHGLDLFSFYFGDVEHVYGVSANQQKLYTAKDAIAACWIFKNGVTKIVFSVFNEEEITLTNENGTTNLFIDHPKHVQQFHVESIREHLLENREHPSTGRSGLHTSWIMGKILGQI